MEDDNQRRKFLVEVVRYVNKVYYSIEKLKKRGVQNLRRDQHPFTDPLGSFKDAEGIWSIVCQRALNKERK